MAKKNLYINNTSLGTYGIYISSDTVLNAPSFDYIEHQVPGRDGTLLQYNNRLNNVIRKFTCYAPLNTTPATAIANVKSLIYSSPGYVKISSDYETGMYQYGYLAQDIVVKPFNRYKTAEFDLYFSCLPKKYFTTQASVVLNGANFTNIRSTLTRNNGFMTRLLNDLPLQYIPNETAFYIIGTSTALTNGTAISGISCSWSEGDTFCAVCTGAASTINDANDYGELVAYGNESISGASHTVSVGARLCFVVPVRTTGTYTVTYTISGNTTTITTPSLSSTTASLTNTSATGASVIMDLDYYFYGLSTDPFIPNAMTFVYYNGTQKMGDCVVVWHTELCTPAFTAKLADYAYYADSTYNFTVTMDFTNNHAVVKKTGMPDLDFDEFMEINGTIPAFGFNKIEVNTFKSGAGGGGKLYADWWAL